MRGSWRLASRCVRAPARVRLASYPVHAPSLPALACFVCLVVLLATASELERVTHAHMNACLQVSFSEQQLLDCSWGYRPDDAAANLGQSGFGLSSMQQLGGSVSPAECIASSCVPPALTLLPSS